MPDLGGASQILTGDIAFLSKKEFNGKLIHLISSEFTNNAVQITHTVPSGKTFYHLKSKLYPVVNTVISNVTNSIVNRRADIEIEFNGGGAIDVLTYDFETGEQTSSIMFGGSGNSWQLESNIVESFDGDGIKNFTLTSTNTSGTYRVSLVGFEEDTGVNPILA